MKTERLTGLFDNIDDDILRQAAETDDDMKFSKLKHSTFKGTLLMKKVIAAAACLCLVTAAALGIPALLKSDNQWKGSYKALEAGNYDSSDGGTHSVEYDLWSSENQTRHENKSAAKELTITINGQTLTGKYKHSLVRKPNNYVSDFYETDDGYRFTVNANTGELVNCWLITAKEEKDLDLPVKSEEELRTIAENIAKQYINVNEYTVKLEIKEYAPDSNHLFDIYNFTFQRYINNIKTTDYVIISVSDKGILRQFSSLMLGKMAKVSLDGFDAETAEAVVKDKVNTVYRNYDSYEIKDQTAVLLQDGSPAMLYKVSVKKEYNNSDGTTCVESYPVDILVVCE